MTVSVSEKRLKLRTVHSNTTPDGSIKKRSFTLANINSQATPDDLFSLGKAIDGVIDGSLASVVKVQDDYYEEA